jgi:hypothetical protein
LRTSSFLLQLLHIQQKTTNVFLNLWLCNSIHTVKSKFLKKITWSCWLDFFPDFIVVATRWEPWRFLGNSDSADRLFTGNFRPVILNTIFVHKT